MADAAIGGKKESVPFRVERDAACVKKDLHVGAVTGLRFRTLKYQGGPAEETFRDFHY